MQTSFTLPNQSPKSVTSDEIGCVTRSYLTQCIWDDFLSHRQPSRLAEVLDSARADLRITNDELTWQIAGASAYLKIWSNKACKNLGIKPFVDPLSVVAFSEVIVRERVGEISPGVAKELIGLLSVSTGLTESLLRQVAREYLSLAGQKADVAPDETPSGPDASAHSLTMPVIEVGESDIVVEENPEISVKGDEADYDFPAKVEWRKAWAAYAKESLRNVNIREVRVCCLPGRKVEPEVRHYLDMGILPENITAIEGGRRPARKEFEDNARRLGIQYHVGRLERVLPTLDTPFTLVNFDFHGSFSTGHINIIAACPIGKSVVFIYNALEKRESTKAQNIMKIAYDESVSTGRMLMSELVKKHRAMGGHLYIEAEDGAVKMPGEPSLRTLRQRIANGLLISLGGFRSPATEEKVKSALQRTGLFSYYEHLFALGPNAAVFVAEGVRELLYMRLRKLICQKISALEEGYDARILRRVDPKKLADVLTVVLTNGKFIGRPVIYSYKSAVSSAQSPFKSQFAEVYSSALFEKPFARFFDFVLDWSFAKRDADKTVLAYTEGLRALPHGQRLRDHHILVAPAHNRPGYFAYPLKEFLSNNDRLLSALRRGELDLNHDGSPDVRVRVEPPNDNAFRL